MKRLLQCCRWFTFGRLIAALSLLALMLLCYVSGAAALYFELPSANYLNKAFSGAQAWYDRSTSRHIVFGELANTRVTVDQTDATYDGYTLFTTVAGPQATLIDMRGNVVHEWKLPYSKAWPDTTPAKNPKPDTDIHWFRCYLYPNGDLLAVYHAEGDTPYGYGLAKMDKDSKLLWTYNANVHHDIDVDDEGRIYTLSHCLVADRPDGLLYVNAPYIADHLVMLSPQGQELDNIPLLDAFRNSPYALTLTTLSRPAYDGLTASHPPVQPGVPPSRNDKGDILHANSVKVLPRSVAGVFPWFKAGQVLLSFRRLDALAVLDPRTRSIVWAANGLWRGQHDAEFLPNGHLLLYDNLGFFQGSRVLEYDPATQAYPWCYANENAMPFIATMRGMKQRLPNGNTLITDPNRGRLFEVTADKALVWECFCATAPGGPEGPNASVIVTGARRYGPQDLTFLSGGTHVRP
jgi:hypothetical protein